VRTIGINGSPRAGGNTDSILEALAAAKEEGAEGGLIRISDYKLKPCDACHACFNKRALLDLFRH
jgi:multimeric flavodoxin WrbA